MRVHFVRIYTYRYIRYAGFIHRLICIISKNQSKPKGKKR